MKMKRLIIPVFLFGMLFTSCSKEDDVIEPEVAETVEEVEETRNLEVEQFIYAGMNEIYLYKADVTELGDTFFADKSAKDEFLSSFGTPTDLYYEGLLSFQDKFSFMTEDYVALRKLLQEGVAGTTGMDYGLSRFSNSDNVFGYVRYVIPGSSADQQGLKRGDFFTEINGESLNINNYQRLLALSSFSLRIASLSGTTISNTEKVAELVKEEIAEDPVHISRVLEVDGRKIGYLMYNGFTPDFDTKLNASFAEFKGEGITDLILDLRYNGGGNVDTAIDLAGMITGQFDEQILLKYEYNQKYQTYFENNKPEALVRRFSPKLRTGEALNSLNLSKVYVIATRSSASASELIINGLKPYIDVVHVGTNTRGKFQASTTLYDAPNFYLTDDDGNVHVNPNHNYAIQPLILKYANKNNESDFVEGLAPTIEKKEDVADLGILGDPSEPLLQATINAITGQAQEEVAGTVKEFERKFRVIGESDMFTPSYQRMYIDRAPAVLQPEIKQ